MSYLSHSLRLHFSGQFQATVSTVNNDVTHFNNQTFQPSYQLRQTASAANGWWNPDGDGVWRLLGCAVTSAFLGDGSAVAASDPVLRFSIADSDDSAPAKIVDLDPQQQMVSTLFGLKIRISDASGNTLMAGDFSPSAFTELWSKVHSTAASGDMAFGAMWQSVVTVSQWGDVSASAFLTALKASADANSNLLSIKFNVDLYAMTWPVPGGAGGNQFCRGRIVGTLGTATVAEPRYFVSGRQLTPLPVGSATSPLLNYAAAVVDPSRNVLRLDLGNAIPVQGSGIPVPLGDLLVQVGGSSPVTVGSLPQSVYTAAAWYNTTAGIVEFPLSAAAASALADNPLQLVLPFTGVPTVQAEELEGGYYVRADRFVFRLSPGDSGTLSFFASRFGQPLASAVIAFYDNPSQLQGTPAPPGTVPGSLDQGAPYVDAPAEGIAYPGTATTDPNGRADVIISGGDPLNFRAYIDGQIYGIGYGLELQGFSPGTGPSSDPANPYSALANPWNFVSVLVFDNFTPDNPPTWQGSMQPIFQQYANLYPVMARFVDLGDYQQVVGYARMLRHAFSLPDEDPNAMPVTRDLSPAKRAAILKWLWNPLEGTTDSRPASQAQENTREAVGAAPPESLSSTTTTASAVSFKGGKSAALARRACAVKP